MSKPKINYIVSMLILVAFLLTGLSGIILLLIPGGRGLSQYAVLGIPRSGWIELHDWAGIASITGVSLHFVLHWKWLTYMSKKMFQWVKPQTSRQQRSAAMEANQ